MGLRVDPGAPGMRVDPGVRVDPGALGLGWIQGPQGLGYIQGPHRQARGEVAAGQPHV